MATPLTSKFLISSWTTRLATATGALAAVALSPAAGKAAVIKVTGSPVSNFIGSGVTSFWDIDGDSQNEFKINNPGTLFFASTGNGRGLASYGQADNVKLFVDSNQVGPTNAFFGSGAYAFRNLMATNGAIGYDFNGGYGGGNAFQQGDNFFGFRFLQGADLLYGYGVLNFDSANKIVTISSWAYNNTPNSSLHVEAITGDAPAVPGPIGLAGLAAGAAWTRKLRRRIKAAA